MRIKYDERQHEKLRQKVEEVARRSGIIRLLGILYIALVAGICIIIGMREWWLGFTLFVLLGACFALGVRPYFGRFAGEVRRVLTAVQAKRYSVRRTRLM